jgi:hypothetical protein
MAFRICFFFDYQAAIEAWDISYMVITEPASIGRFAGDRFFSLVYKNNEIAIFRMENRSK